MGDFAAQWIHDLQTAVMAGEVETKEDVTTHPKISGHKYRRLFIVGYLIVTDHGFQCTIKINPSLEPDETELTFDDDTVPSKISLDGRTV